MPEKQTPQNDGKFIIGEIKEGTYVMYHPPFGEPYKVKIVWSHYYSHDIKDKVINWFKWLRVSNGREAMGTGKFSKID